MTSWDLVSSQSNIYLNMPLHWLWRCQMLAFVASPSNQNTDFSAKYPAVARVQCGSVTALTHVNAFCAACWALLIYSAEKPQKYNQSASHPISQERQKRGLTVFLCNTQSPSYTQFLIHQQTARSPSQIWQHRDKKTPLYLQNRHSRRTSHLTFPMNRIIQWLGLEESSKVI